MALFRHQHRALPATWAATSMPAPLASDSTKIVGAGLQCSSPIAPSRCRNPASSVRQTRGVCDKPKCAFQPNSQTPSIIGDKTFAMLRPITLIDTAAYLIFVHWLMIHVPRLLPTLSRPHAVAIHFAHGGQLATEPETAGVHPCWANQKKSHREVACEGSPWGNVVGTLRRSNLRLTRSKFVSFDAVTAAR